MFTYHEPLDAKIYLSDLPSAFLLSQACQCAGHVIFFHPQACMARGQVMTSDGTPLVGVNISFVNNPLFWIHHQQAGWQVRGLLETSASKGPVLVVLPT